MKKRNDKKRPMTSVWVVDRSEEDERRREGREKNVQGP